MKTYRSNNAFCLLRIFLNLTIFLKLCEKIRKLKINVKENFDLYDIKEK